MTVIWKLGFGGAPILFCLLQKLLGGLFHYVPGVVGFQWDQRKWYGNIVVKTPLGLWFLDWAIFI
jgi:hypothetical protein